MADLPKPDQPSTPPAPWEARARTWTALVFGLAAVLVGAYYFFILQADQRRVALEARYAQRVAHVARQAERKLQVYARIVSSTLDAAKDATHGGTHDALLPSYKKLVDECESTAGSSDDRQSEAKRDTAASLCIARRIARIAAPSPSAPGNALTLRECPITDAPRGKPSTRREGDRVFFLPGHGKLCGELALSALFPDRSTPAQRAEADDALAGLVLLDQTGSSIWQEPSATVRLRTLPKLNELADKSAKASGSAMVKQLSLGSGTYRVFVEPLDLSLSATDGKLSLCGLVKEDSLIARSKRIAPVSMLWAGLLLVLGALSFPLAKLWLLAPRSRFRTTDVRLLVLCAIAATLATASVFLGFLARYRLNEHLDERLTATAALVKGRLEQRLRGAEDALEALAQRFDFSAPGAQRFCTTVDGASLPDCAVMTPSQGHAVCECTAQHGKSGLFRSDAGRRGFQRAFWSESEGQQLLKLAPGAHATPSLNLGTRSYFRRALKLGEQSCPQRTHSELPTTFDIVRSMTSGSIVLLGARATCGQQDGQRVVNGVLGVEASLDDFVVPLLPPHFQLAVVDASGKVVLHSDNDSHQGQSIFGEIEGLEAVAALARVPETGVTYLGEASRVAALSMLGGYWVLTIAPQVLVDGPAQSMTLATLELCAMMLVAGLLFWLLLRLFRLSLHAGEGSDSRLSRLFMLTTFRPYPRLGATYAWLGLSLLVSTAVSAVIILCKRPGPIVCGALVLTISAGLYSLVRGRPAPTRTGLARAYATYCFGASAALLMLPAMRAFVGCYQHHVETMVQEEVAYVWSALRERPDCLLQRCEDVFALLPSADADPPGPDVRAQHAQLLDPSWLAFIRRIEGVSAAPIAEVLAQFPALHHPHPELPGRLEILPGPDYAEVRFTLPQEEVRSLRLALPRLASAKYPLLARLFMACALLALALTTFTLWTRSIGRLFFIDALVWQCEQPRDVDALRALLARQPERSLLYLHPPAELAALALASPGFACWPPQAADDDGAKIFVVRELGDMLDCAALLSGLEHARERKLQVVVFSHVDPLDASNAEARERWLALFAHFSCVQGTDFHTLRADSPAAIALAWETSSDDERRLLAQLAFDGHASPSRQNLPVVRRLVARGLLQRETFLLAHQELREYVRSRSSTAALSEAEAKDGGGPWSMLRVPIVTAVLVLLAGVSQGQPDAMPLTVPGLALSIPLMLRALISVTATRAGIERLA